MRWRTWHIHDSRRDTSQVSLRRDDTRVQRREHGTPALCCCKECRTMRRHILLQATREIGYTLREQQLYGQDNGDSKPADIAHRNRNRQRNGTATVRQAVAYRCRRTILCVQQPQKTVGKRQEGVHGQDCKSMAGNRPKED